MDASEYEAVIEQHVRAELELADDEPLPPGPVAIATELVRERERPFVEALTARMDTWRQPLEELVRVALLAAPIATPEVVWRDPALPRKGDHVRVFGPDGELLAEGRALDAGPSGFSIRPD